MTDNISAKVWDNVPSPFCGIASDDLKIEVFGSSVRVLANGDAVTIPGFEQPVTDTAPRIAGKQVSLDEAVQRAAAILKDARLPVFSGFGTDVNDTRAALALIAVAICEMRPMVAPISLIETTESRVAACMLEICASISPVALPVWAASVLTSWATTAKPLPASPARAASMVAFSASRLVCWAMPVITLITCPISALAAILAVAAALRSYLYWVNPAMTMDEAMLACNVLRIGPGDAFGVLPYFSQAAPAGFLLVSKAMGLLAGYGEHALRLPVFLARHGLRGVRERLLVRALRPGR